MITVINTKEELDIELEVGKQIYFRLAGGLGNQLFGLSEAFNLHNRLKCGVLIDIGSIEHTVTGIPEWSDWARNQNWLNVIHIPESVSCEFVCIDLGIAKYEEILKSKFFTGWRFSTQIVEESGLFTRSEFPFKVQEKPQIPIALHYRAGDYAHAEGIGILKPQYYSRALQRMDSFQKVTVFTDDRVAAKEFISKIKTNHLFEISDEESALATLYRLSKAKILISANSTLSWWALYFSCSIESIAPKPFYLQIWNFDSLARFTDTIYISRFGNLIEFCLNRMQWFLRSIL